MTSSIRSQLITNAIDTRLKTLPGVTVYRGEVPDQPPLMVDGGRVAPYLVHYPFPAKPGPGGDLAGASDDLDYGTQVSCAAGFVEDCERLVDLVHQLLFHWIPTVEGLVLGWLVPPLGFDPGPIRVDRTIAPPRSSLPLQYRLVATAN